MPLRLGRRAIFLACVSVCAAHAHPAGAQTGDACRSAYEGGQRLRRAGKLLAARGDFLLCARDPCPAVFQPECIAWLGEVERLLPAVAIEVRKNGQPMSDVRVVADGEVLATKLDGRRVPLDPGEHLLRVEPGGLPPREQRELIVEGETSRRVVFDYVTRDATTPPPAPVPWAAAVSTGVAALALGSFTYFGLTGVQRYHTLERCGHACSQSDIDYVNTHFDVADVALGVSAVAIGLATYLWIRWASSSRTAPERRVGVVF